MKKILLSQRLIQNPSYPEIREALDIQWGAFLSKCGLLPIALSFKAPLDEYFRLIKPDGVLLTGGNDLASLNPTDPLCKMRDEFESRLIEIAVKSKIPLLGVCRGAQMVAHFFGSTFKKRDGHVGINHRVRFQGRGIFEANYSQKTLVNSYHGFCIQSTGKELLTEGIVETDQTVEAFSHKSLPIFGMMWHPERVDPFLVSDISFFKKIFKA